MESPHAASGEMTIHSSNLHDKHKRKDTGTSTHSPFMQNQSYTPVPWILQIIFASGSRDFRDFRATESNQEPSHRNSR